VFNPIPVNTFADRVRTAVQARSKDIRITMAEATELVAAIAQLQALALGHRKSSAMDQVVSLDAGDMRR